MTERSPEQHNDYRPFTAMEFRRIARMNKHQLWSIAVAWSRDRTTAAAVLTQGLTDAWSAAQPGAGDFAADTPPTSAQITAVIYQYVLNSSSGSLAAQDTESDPLSPRDISFYIMAAYSPLPRSTVCDLLDVSGDGSDILDRVTEVLIRDAASSR